MSASYRSHTTYAPAVATTSHTINVPAGVQDGDILIAAFTHPVGTSTAAHGSWTEILDAYSTLPANDTGLYVAYRTAASEPASYTFTVGVSGRPAGFMVAYKDTTGYDKASFQVTTGDATQESPSVTPSEDGCTLLYICNGFDGAAGTTINWTEPSGFTERIDHENANNHSAIYLADKVQTTAAAISATATANQTSEGYAGLVVIKAAAAPASTFKPSVVLL